VNNFNVFSDIATIVAKKEIFLVLPELSAKISSQDI